MTNGQAYFNGWKKGLDFSGVASRQEFWSFLLINLLILALPLAAWFLAMQHNSQYGVFIFFAAPLSGLLSLPMIVPLLARWLPQDARYRSFRMVVRPVPYYSMVFDRRAMAVLPEAGCIFSLR